jgi:hypothetical protein
MNIYSGFVNTFGGEEDKRNAGRAGVAVRQ